MKGETGDMNVFKSFLRQLLVQLKDLQEAIRTEDKERAVKIIDQLILNIQAGIEDD